MGVGLSFLFGGFALTIRNALEAARLQSDFERYAKTDCNNYT